MTLAPKCTCEGGFRFDLDCVDPNCPHHGSLASKKAKERHKARIDAEEFEMAIITGTIKGYQYRIAELEKEREAFKDLIGESGPMAWVVNEDMEGAYEWEKKAADLIGINLEK